MIFESEDTATGQLPVTLRCTCNICGQEHATYVSYDTDGRTLAVDVSTHLFRNGNRHGTDALLAIQRSQRGNVMEKSHHMILPAGITQAFRYRWKLDSDGHIRLDRKEWCTNLPSAPVAGPPELQPHVEVVPEDVGAQRGPPQGEPVQRVRVVEVVPEPHQGGPAPE